MTNETDSNNDKPHRFDLKKYTDQIKAELPAPGRHTATIVNIDYSEKPDVVWLFVDWQLEGHDDTVRQIIALEAEGEAGEEPDLNRTRQLAKGLFQLQRIAKAADFDLVAEISDYPDFAKLVGIKAEIVVGRRHQAGIPDACVNTVIA